MVKENFCGMCAALPMALMGVGASASGLSMTKDEYQKKRKWMIAIGILSIIFSIFIIWWYRSCKSCRK